MSIFQKMMAIAGRSPDGKARALKTDESGVLETKLTENVDVGTIKKIEPMSLVGSVVEPTPDYFVGAANVFGFPLFWEVGEGDSVLYSADINDKGEAVFSSRKPLPNGNFLIKTNSYGKITQMISNRSSTHAVIDNESNIYTLTSGTGRVRKFNAKGEQVWETTGFLNGLQHIRVNDFSGNVYVGGNSFVLKIDKNNGNILWSRTLPTSTNRQIDVDDDEEYVYFGSNNTVGRINCATQEIDSDYSVETNGTVNAIGIDRAKSVIVGTQTGRIRKLASNKTVLWEVNLGTRINRVEIDVSGMVFAAGHNGVLFRVSSDGRVLEPYNNQNRITGAMYGLGINKKGQVVFSVLSPGEDRRGVAQCIYGELQHKGYRMVERR